MSSKEDKDKMGKLFEEVVENIWNDPKVRELAEENLRKHGTLTVEDSQKTFTI